MCALEPLIFPMTRRLSSHENTDEDGRAGRSVKLVLSFSSTDKRVSSTDL